MPSQDRNVHSTRQNVAGIESLAKRLEQLANKVEHLVAGDSRVDSSASCEAGHQPEVEGDDSPRNPLRHWRWE